MDAPIASTGLPPQPPQRPIEFARVQPAPPAQDARQDTQQDAQSFASKAAARLANRLTAERSVERDADTGSLVYRLIDLSSGIVTIQTPNDARLKLRAYIDGVIASGREPAVEVMA